MRLVVSALLISAMAACGSSAPLKDKPDTSMNAQDTAPDVSDGAHISCSGASIDAGSAPDARGEVASIRITRSTNSAEIDVVVFSDGSAQRTIGPSPDGNDPAPESFPPGSPEVETFLNDLAAVGDVSAIPADPGLPFPSHPGCVKSASFGTITTITACGKTSGDLQCLDPGVSAAATALASDVSALAGRYAGVPNWHRAVATSCPTARPAASCMTNTSGAPVNGGNCNVDADCKDGQNGRCSAESPNAGFCSVCSYDACFMDADCQTAGPCDCRASFGGANMCAAGNCRVDSDCGQGRYCSPSIAPCSGYPSLGVWAIGYYCRTAKDTCVADADCTTPTQIRPCRYESATAAWRCFDFPGCPT